MVSKTNKKLNLLLAIIFFTISLIFFFFIPPTNNIFIILFLLFIGGFISNIISVFLKHEGGYIIAGYIVAVAILKIFQILDIINLLILTALSGTLLYIFKQK